jgi:hypothetical protein
MPDKKIDDSERRKALKKLIAETVDSAGGLAPEEIPHRVRERLKDQALGGRDVEDLIAEALKDRGGKRR